MLWKTESGSSHPMLSHADRLAAAWQDFLLLAGRVLIGLIFVQSGWGKLTNIGGFVATMPRRGLPEFLGWVAPPVEFLGGLALLVGFATRYTALVILLFTVVATLSSHRYWAFPAAERGGQQTHFMKNVSMMGGILLLFVTGAGRFSLDRLLARRR